VLTEQSRQKKNLRQPIDPANHKGMSCHPFKKRGKTTATKLMKPMTLNAAANHETIKDACVTTNGELQGKKRMSART
jgi:hypothetical protein